MSTLRFCAGIVLLVFSGVSIAGSALSEGQVKLDLSPAGAGQLRVAITNSLGVDIGELKFRVDNKNQSQLLKFTDIASLDATDRIIKVDSFEQLKIEAVEVRDKQFSELTPQVIVELH